MQIVTAVHLLKSNFIQNNMKKLILITTILLSAFSFSQVKSTQKGYYNAVADTTMLSNNTRFDKAFVEGLNYGINNGNATITVKQPDIVIELTDLLQTLQKPEVVYIEKQLIAPILEKITKVNDAFYLEVKESVEKPLSYMLKVNDIVYDNININEPILITIDETVTNDFTLIPIYKESNKITLSK
jgi:hypothetical protein